MKMLSTDNTTDKRIMRFILVAALMLGMVISANASQILDPTDIGVGARPLGLGKAFTAIANDGSAIFTNPAGLAQSKTLNVVSMAGNLMSEVPYTVAGGSYPLFGGTIGIGYAGLGVSGINETTIVNGTPEITGNQGNYANSAINVSYAQSIGDLSIFKEPKLGATFKIISQGFSGTSSFEAGKGTGFDIDLGALASINEDTNVGITLKNIIPGNNFQSDEIPMVIQGGIAKAFAQYNLLTSLDLEYNRTILLHAGAEWSPLALIKLRAGVDQKPSAGSSITNLAAGLGVNFRGFTFDYAYHTYAELSEFATHYFSIGYSLEKPKAAVATAAPAAPAVNPAPVPVKVVQPAAPVVKTKVVTRTVTKMVPKKK